ncbi:histidine kinase dimerization/phosphoacceptor domain -containing protein [Sphingomonas sp. LY54]|uniref:sensor histidine kinase n=1 Tax=Sphingomonas sp. LY54 TaxID=3095343 RepID=UPI002D787AA2|nr:histidine kinase dimerization/phosphoacceptor domain -containing protein [Sphingomonas sp. LY54]WRP29505.1 histidine kinase dimerization/phosphoacceptor domain -containing protein [Sphingomonas sp. LY54]
MNRYEENMADTPARTRSERHMDDLREQGGMFVEAVRLTRMPMIVTDATLPGNPIIFANEAFIELSGYTAEELTGQDPHFMNGEGTDPDAIREYESAMEQGRDVTLEIVQYRKDGASLRAMLFASPLNDDQGSVTNHFLSYLDITRRHEAEEDLRALTHSLEAKVAARTSALEQTNRELSKLAGEKEMLLAEVNHRAKNSLAIASSLLSIQGRRQSDPAVRAHFQEAQDRLMAMARVHDLLSKSETSQRVDLATYIGDLCEALRPITDHDDCVSMTADVEKGILVHADTAVPLGIVATELITNAVKYAFPHPRCGTIMVQTRRRHTGNIELVIKDDGVGMSEVRDGSLGYGLVRMLVRQISGQIDVRNDGGVVVTILFPDAQHGRDDDPALAVG